MAKATATSKETLKCPLKLDCYPSCAWWKDCRCIFPKEAKLKREGRVNEGRNPYPDFLIDEASGIKVHNIRHEIWARGYEAGIEDGSNTQRAEYLSNTGKPKRKLEDVYHFKMERITGEASFRRWPPGYATYMVTRK